MGNSYCYNYYNYYDKPQQLITKSEINVDFNAGIHEKDINNNLYSNIIYTKNDYVNKSTIGVSPQSVKCHQLINPLPDIVTIKFKKTK